MTRDPNDPIHRYQILLFKNDVKVLVDHYGYGWSSHIRGWVREKANEIRKPKPRTIGELIDE